MKILAFSGLHGNEDLVNIFTDSVVQKDLKPDIFACVGDIGDSIIVELFEELQQFKKPIIFVLGNHTILDNEPKEVKKAERLENVFHLDKTIFSFKNCTFIGQDAWSHFADNKEIDKLRFKNLSRKIEKAKSEKIILVSHHAPLGILDRGISYPEHSWKDQEGYLHAGSYSIRKIIEQFHPLIHLFAHCHSDGGKWEVYNQTLFANVCHLERKTRSREIGINGSFMVVDTNKNTCIPHHLTRRSSRKCYSCGSVNYLNYGKCFNCYSEGKSVIGFQELKDVFDS